MDRVYEYKSCHGKNGTICGKIVKPGETHCSKNSCAIPFSEQNLNDDYVVTLKICAFWREEWCTSYYCIQKIIIRVWNQGYNYQWKAKEHLM